MQLESDARPLLRPLDFQPVLYQGQPMWFLRDPLQLSDQQLFMPEAIAPLLTLIDGRRTQMEIHSAFCQLVGTSLDPAVTLEAIERLNDALLLENERSQRALQVRLDEYRSQAYRPPALAGNGYPADPEALAEYLEGFARGGATPTWHGRGLVSPHIDYARGGQVYSQVWAAAEASILKADLVLIFGTDHYGGPGTVTLTKQAYATPYGALPADSELVGRLAAALGEDAAYAEELHHRSEHSVELSAVWLHHIFHKAGKEPCPVVPILVGSFHHFVMNGRKPADDSRLNVFLETLQQETSGRHVLAVASVDLAHVGPNFGDEFVMDRLRRESLAEQDQQLMAAALDGDAESWYSQIAAVGDRNRICGFAPTYLMLRYLGKSNGLQIAYDQCTADNQDTSLVSICGLLIE
ncbi:MAG: AmmeMemoRadiSam system protein B [Candidatus Promineifilaceae bacterium]